MTPELTALLDHVRAMHWIEYTPDADIRPGGLVLMRNNARTYRDSSDRFAQLRERNFILTVGMYPGGSSGHYAFSDAGHISDPHNPRGPGYFWYIRHITHWKPVSPRT